MTEAASNANDSLVSDDEPLTEDERLREIAKLLAAGLLRLRTRPQLPSSPAHVPVSENPGN